MKAFSMIYSLEMHLLSSTFILSGSLSDRNEVLEILTTLICNFSQFALILIHEMKRKLIRISMKIDKNKIKLQGSLSFMYLTCCVVVKLPERLASKFHRPSPWLEIYWESKLSSSRVQGPLLSSLSSSLELLTLFEVDMAILTHWNYKIKLCLYMHSYDLNGVKGETKVTKQIGLRKMHSV